MVSGFRRSFSFPNRPTQPTEEKQKSVHHRSTSLPCLSRAIVSQLRDGIVGLVSWQSGARSSAWVCDGLRLLKGIHESLEDLLHLPQTRESLLSGARACLIENLLEEFLQFVDVYGSFQSLFLTLKEEHRAAQIDLRRRDDSNKIASCSKNLCKIAREIGKLRSNFNCVGKSLAAGAPDPEAVELIEAISDVIDVTASTSDAIFGGICNSSAFRGPKQSLRLSLKKKWRGEEGIKELSEVNLEMVNVESEEEVKMASKRMMEMEDRMVEIEICVDMALRSLINTRVSLLNVATQV